MTRRDRDELIALLPYAAAVVVIVWLGLVAFFSGLS